MEIVLDKLKAEEELERIVNADMTTEAKTPLIKEQLIKLNNLTQMASMWAAYCAIPQVPEEQNNN